MDIKKIPMVVQKIMPRVLPESFTKRELEDIREIFDNVENTRDALYEFEWTIRNNGVVVESCTYNSNEIAQVLLNMICCGVEHD